MNKYIKNILTIIIIGVCLVGLFNGLIDPYMHFHLPYFGLQNSMQDERYLNDGIARHYEYGAMITGTSMTQNFAASQFEGLWGSKTVKTSFSGASVHELNNHIKRAAGYNPELEYVLCSLDGSRIIAEYDWDSYDNIPEYLYDDNVINDIEYLMNKDVLLSGLNMINFTRSGGITPSMDEYGAWYPWAEYGKEAVEASYIPGSGDGVERHLSEEEKQLVIDNIEKNYLQTALDNPHVTFYFFYPPYSDYYWQKQIDDGNVYRQIEAEEVAAEVLLRADNVHLYRFTDKKDWTSNPENYMDTMHFMQWISEDIMHMIHDGECEVMRPADGKISFEIPTGLK